VSTKALLRNISASWLGLGADAVTGFLLTPFLLHRIGPTAFGVWVLVSAFGGYYGLLDFGTRNAIVRFVARYNAQGDEQSLRRAISSALAGYTVIAVVAMIATTIIAWKAEVFFHIEPDFVSTAKLLIVVFGIGAALGFPLSVFGGVLEGLQRFGSVGVVQATASVTRAVVIVALMLRGGTVITVAVVTITANILAGLVNAFVAARALPRVRPSVQAVSFESLRELTSFGLVTFWVGVANRLRFQSDSVIIGALLSVTLISPFAIGVRLLTYATEVIATMSSVLTPLFSDLSVRESPDALRASLERGNRYAGFLAFPFAALVMFHGGRLVDLWVGGGYEASERVMRILAIPMFAYVSQSASTAMLYGLAKHHFLARVLLYEGLANIALSVILAQQFGIVGVALGTAIPLSVTAFVVLPMHVCRTVGMSVLDYARAYMPPLFALIPMIAVWTVEGFLPSSTSLLRELGFIALGGAGYCLGFLAVWRTTQSQSMPSTSTT
jgi:O-antigen/teichoic acid export membrane protein